MKPNEVVQGDVGPFLFLLEDENGPVRIPPGSTVEWLQGPLRVGALLPSFVASAESLDEGDAATKGRGQLVATGQTAVPGVYGIQFRVTYPGGAQSVFPSTDPEELIVRRLVAAPVPAGVDGLGPWLEPDVPSLASGVDGTGPWIDGAVSSPNTGVDLTGPWIE